MNSLRKPLTVAAMVVALAVIGTLRDPDLGATHRNSGLVTELWTRARSVTLGGLKIRDLINEGRKY